MVAAFPQRPTLNQAWTDTIAHAPSLLITWLITVLLGGLSALVGFVVSLLFGAMDDGSGVGISLGVVIGWMAQLPLIVLQSLVGVLLTAIPAIYYCRSQVVSFSDAYSLLMARLGRYLLAGVLFGFAVGVGFVLCVVPGIAVSLVMPVYVNKVFTSDLDVITCFTSSFSAVYGSEKGWSLVGIQLVAFLIAFVTCGFCLVGLLVYVPVVTFYLQACVNAYGLAGRSA